MSPPTTTSEPLAWAAFDEREQQALGLTDLVEFLQIAERCVAQCSSEVRAAATAGDRERLAVGVLRKVQDECEARHVDLLAVADLPRWLTWSRHPDRQRHVRRFGGRRVSALLDWLHRSEVTWLHTLHELSGHVLLLPTAALVVEHAYKRRKSRADWHARVPMDSMVPRMKLDKALHHPWKSFHEAAPSPSDPTSAVELEDFLVPLSTGSIRHASSVAQRKATGVLAALDGAAQGNPDGVSQAAHSVLELFTRYLRDDHGVSDADLQVWEAQTQIPEVRSRLRSGSSYTTFASVLWIATKHPDDLAGDWPLADDLRFMCGAVSNDLKKGLNQLKHRDVGNPHEVTELRRLGLTAASIVWLLDNLS